MVKVQSVEEKSLNQKKKKKKSTVYLQKDSSHFKN